MKQPRRSRAPRLGSHRFKHRESGVKVAYDRGREFVHEQVVVRIDGGSGTGRGAAFSLWKDYENELAMCSGPAEFHHAADTCLPRTREIHQQDVNALDVEQVARHDRMTVEQPSRVTKRSDLRDVGQVLLCPHRIDASHMRSRRGQVLDHHRAPPNDLAIAQSGDRSRQVDRNRRAFLGDEAMRIVDRARSRRTTHPRKPIGVVGSVRWVATYGLPCQSRDPFVPAPRGPIVPDPTGYAGERLYLFSSNLQPVYVQNVLDVIAAPSNSVHVLRYQSKWLPQDTRDRWNDAMRGQPVLLHFSLQHANQLFQPEFVPLRTGLVDRVKRDGDFFRVWVRITGDAAPRLDPDDATDDKTIGNRVRAYRSMLAQRSIPHPYAVSAALGPDIMADLDGSVLDTAIGTTDALTRHARVFSRIADMAQARFIRFVSVTDLSSSAAVDLHCPDEGDPYLPLKGGRTYRLEVFLYDPGAMSRFAQFDAAADDQAIRFVGSPSFEVGAHYDIPSLLFQTTSPPNGKTLGTRLQVRAVAGQQGPRLDIPVQIKASAGETALTLGGSLLVLVLISLGTVVKSDWRIAILSVAIILAGLLQWRGYNQAGALVGPVQTGFKPAPPVTAAPTTGGLSTAPGPPAA